MSDSEPISEDDPTPNASREPDIKTSHADPSIPPTASPPNPPPTQTHHYVTYKKEKDWWDKTKPFIEIAGVLFLALYTGYTIKMYHANRDAADAAKSAAETASSVLTQSKIDATTQDKRARDGMAASAKQSQAALDASIESLRSAERPIFALDSDPIKFGGFQPGVVQDVAVRLKNIGKGPAHNITVEAWLVFPGESVIAPALSINPNKGSQSILPANEVYQTPLFRTQNEISRMQTSQGLLQGRVIYAELRDVVTGGQILGQPATYCDVFCVGTLPDGRTIRCGGQPLCDRNSHDITFAPVGSAPPNPQNQKKK